MLRVHQVTCRKRDDHFSASKAGWSSSFYLCILYTNTHTYTDNHMLNNRHDVVIWASEYMLVAAVVMIFLLLFPTYSAYIVGFGVCVLQFDVCAKMMNSAETRLHRRRQTVKYFSADVVLYIWMFSICLSKSAPQT